MLLGLLPLISALTLLLAPSSQAAAFVASSASIAPTPENACTAFLCDGSESRIGLLCHNDPVNRSDPFGLIDREIDPQVDKLGAQASLNSLKQAANGAPAGVSQAVQEKDGKLSLGSKFGKSEIVTKKKLIGGRLQTVSTLKETAKSDEGHKVVAVGHVHQDKSIHAGPGFSGTDYKTAQGSEGHPGQPVYKINESNPSVIIRLTPQVDYHDTPTERVISR